MRHIQLMTERPVEQFLLRLFLRDADMRSLCIVSRFISSIADCRFSLADLRRKIDRERICTYIITRPPEEEYQVEAMTALFGSPWIYEGLSEAVSNAVPRAANWRIGRCFAAAERALVTRD